MILDHNQIMRCINSTPALPAEKAFARRVVRKAVAAKKRLEAYERRAPTNHEVAQLIADEIVLQGNEIDNLGDNDSIVLMGKSPTINLVQLAERLTNSLKRA